MWKNKYHKKAEYNGSSEKTIKCKGKSMRYYHIFVEKKGQQEKRGKAANIDELLKLLTRKEIQTIFACNAFQALSELFKTASAASEDSYIIRCGTLTINCISNGYEVTSLVIYL